MNRTAATLLTAAALSVSIGCAESTDSAESTTATTTPAWILASAPEQVADIKPTKQSAAEGETVTLRGTIGGRVDALSNDSATFVMMDINLPNPCLADDDHCPTPWDYCCATAAEKVANNATVQLVNADGAPIATNLRDHGIEPLDTVIVTGTVGPRLSNDVLFIKASGIYVAE